jgi:DNA anti-recombination protein RmuC
MDRDERIQRQMDFIVEQQAHFLTDIERLRKDGERVSKNIEKVNKSIDKMESVITRFANATLNRFEENEEKIAMLVDAQLRTEQKIEKLVESQQSTDERLNAVIFMFEKFISRENGK